MRIFLANVCISFFYHSARSRGPAKQMSRAFAIPTVSCGYNAKFVAVLLHTDFTGKGK